ncbi:hypothetical protein PHYSODRAFT_319298 [Phytophthora sojae]|uniref:Uncharacterized protein n=1 Tax=Phytophthora sojae (strain P6497) TaxID=1094619 RepID=G5AA16_PHYSP|nr:hypothetical protein PHYSODRAFT_319298 [Phytophthora sojae]EGZ07445.1 hypothetical protein PHYSODRAFT_319298 [Phytophthora sojae]|eukprot:XP_009537011.1 hypothetical protein PHYSODRAFT_319298 [Phytophthora sojae]
MATSQPTSAVATSAAGTTTTTTNAVATTVGSSLTSTSMATATSGVVDPLTVPAGVVTSAVSSMIGGFTFPSVTNNGIPCTTPLMAGMNTAMLSGAAAGYGVTPSGYIRCMDMVILLPYQQQVLLLCVMLEVECLESKTSRTSRLL